MNKIEHEIPEGYEARIEGNKVILEPKESKNERIRKALISILKSDFEKDTAIYDINVGDIIAWLEKQGEHNKFLQSIQIGDEVTRNPDGVLVNLSQFKRVAKQDSQNLANSAKTCKVEQNPAWSEEDEIRFESTLHRMEIVGNGCAFGQLKDDIDWLKSLKERVQPQSKQEWSEEDEKVLETIISDYIAASKSFCGHQGKLDFLKSLKERYTWKPSEEQMKQLGLVVERNKDTLIGEGLMTLFNDLKKLKK